MSSCGYLREDLDSLILGCTPTSVCDDCNEPYNQHKDKICITKCMEPDCKCLMGRIDLGIL